MSTPKLRRSLIALAATAMTLVIPHAVVNARSEPTRLNAVDDNAAVAGQASSHFSAGRATSGRPAAAAVPPPSGHENGPVDPGAPVPSASPETEAAVAGEHEQAAPAPDSASSAASSPADPTLTVTPAVDAGEVGFNWPNAVAVYVNHWDQRSVTYADRSLPFRVAEAHGVTVMRTFFGTVDSFRATRSTDPAVREAAWSDLRSLLDDAASHGVKLVLSDYLTEEAVEALTGVSYGSWPDARRALTTPGSPAWLALQQWIEEATSRFGDHPAAWSWEVMNEPGWMLGIDDGSVDPDAAAHFLDTFQGQLKRAGATVNAGGRPKYDTTLLTDGQVRLMTRNVDVLDDHLYPEGGTAEAMLNAAAAYRDRVARLTGRALPFMLGEFGTAPQEFFDAVMVGAGTRDFLRIAWGFDAYDDNSFSSSARSGVLTAIAAENDRQQ